MSVRAIYTCDKCKKEQDSDFQFWTVGVTANHGVTPSNHFVAQKSLQVCRPCLEGFGIFVQTRGKPDKSEPKTPTLEELIMEIVERGLEQ